MKINAIQEKPLLLIKVTGLIDILCSDVASIDYLLSLFFVIQVHLPPLIKSLHLFIFFYVVKNLFMLSKKKKPLTIASLYS